MSLLFLKYKIIIHVEFSVSKYYLVGEMKSAINHTTPISISVQ